ncbi:MASE1 domain-containing protein [Streptomyces sp. NPDC001939]|uniref:MASE1 domain-containing protein n=2 Tax=Streptomyces TaxID=1883 RepID=UPI001D09BD8A|nr:MULTISPECIES: MASE1 domain-containing protein [Streptomyces]MCX5082671.1 MASE1 domain-containing protein [Streptomyces sp. NBC_00401]UDM00848.1 MASE1 domain-containing protein [Streptomyces longhuiensis]
MVRTEELRRLSEALLRVLAVAAAYYATGRLGLWQRIVLEGAVVTPLWLPTGVAVTCLLWMGLRIWPGIALGAFLLIQSIGSFSLSDLGIVAANTLAPVCAYLLLRKVGFRIALDRLRDGVALVFLGALLPILLSATVGACVLALSGKLAWSAFWPVWAAWWAGDAMGVLVGTPLLIALSRVRLPLNTHRWPEVAALVAAAVVITPLATRSPLALLFLVFPLLMWAALRFQLAGAAPCVLFVSVLGISAATDHVGPFASHTLFEVMVNLQALNGSAALSALLLAAMVTEQKSVRQKIEQAVSDLTEVVEHLAAPRREE